MKDKGWTDEGVFQRTGIQDTNGKFYIGKNSSIDKYAYRLGTSQEAFQLGMTEITQSKANVSPALNTHINNIHQKTDHQQDEVQILKLQLQQEQAQRIRLENEKHRDKETLESEMEHMKKEMEMIKKLLLDKQNLG